MEMKAVGEKSMEDVLEYLVNWLNVKCWEQEKVKDDWDLVSEFWLKKNTLL